MIWQDINMAAPDIMKKTFAENKTFKRINAEK